MQTNNWGSTLIGAIVLLLLAGGLYTLHSINESREKAEQERQAEEQRQQKLEFERELRAFAESNPDLKVVQEMIDELEQEIQIRQKKLSKLAGEMRRASKVPDTDRDYIRWNAAILELQKKLTALLAERKETWVEWKKVENNPDPTPEVNQVRDERIKKARKLAEKTRDQFNELRTNSQLEDALSVPEEEKKPEKPARKKWFGIF
jgi:hypothetical protein